MDGNNERSTPSRGSNFHSTVLGLSQSEEDTRDRHHERRDVLNPVSGSSHHPPGFSLRSPTRSDYRPSSYGSASHHSPPRSTLSGPNPNSYLSSASSPSGGQGPAGGLGAPLPPPSIGSSSSNHHSAHPTSPLHPPAGYYGTSRPSEGGEAHRSHDKPPSTSSYYDPLTDTTKERRVSESSSWHGAAQQAPASKTRESYGYPTDQQSSHPYYNGNYTSPQSQYKRPLSPLSHSHPTPAAAAGSPSQRHGHRASPTPKHEIASSVMTSSTNGASTLPSLRATSPPRSSSGPSAPAPRADPMSFSNILSSAEPAPKPKAPSPPPAEREPAPPKREEPEGMDLDKIEAAPAKKTHLEADDGHQETDQEQPPKEADIKVKKRGGRRSTKGRPSEGGAEKPKGRPKGTGKKGESPHPRVPSKRQVNGQPKPEKTWSTEMERKIQRAENQLEHDIGKLDPDEFDHESYLARASKRRKEMAEIDLKQGWLRRDDMGMLTSKTLLFHAELGKRRYDDVFYEEALQEVREQELHAEKERKKDMQRKRRREKSMAVTMEQHDAAMARAEAADDEAEKQRHLRDAERAGKKAQQTKLILEKGIKGPARNHLEVSMEGGGTMSSFLASDVETPKGKGKSKAGSRPKKSKEQKQAEKDSAEAAQAAIDAGEELPPPPEGKVRIKIKGRPKAKDKAAKDEKDKEKDTKEPKEEGDDDSARASPVEDIPSTAKAADTADPDKKFASKGYNQIYDQIWRDMARKDVNKTFKLAVDSYATKSSNLKKTAILASKEAKRWQLRTNKGTKDLQARAKRCMRDMMGFWKRNEREERDMRKQAEKQEIENARKEEAERESARQKRKLNFLISQTELYSHFIGKKIKTDEVERSTDNPDVAPDKHQISETKLTVNEPTAMGGKVTNFENLTFEEGDEENLQAAAVANAQNAIAEAQRKAREFNDEKLDMDDEGEMNFQNPTGMGDVEIEQPKLLTAQLKEYQLKGLNWLVNLYEQGINGILADEMGLGKTIQSISVMAYLAEKHDVWGPFLVVAPASTLHNWQQEIAKFVPEFKILPYWGSAPDRKVLRKFWDRKHSMYRKDAPFHVCITSYQLVVSDVAYFQKMKWQYMILDEAQAIKSSQSSRWKSLLGFHCRNRLLLTGTPIQNNMQELWALLHFIMPSLFDSHDEFSEWFSKDIESHAQSNTKLNEDQLKRLHMILKPFMLRRVKKHVQKELGDKIELDVFCDLTYRQRAYYMNLRNQINIMDLMEKATMGDDKDTGTLLNLVMQFRKVCNHPDLFERAEVSSPYSCSYFAETASFVREGNTVAVGYSTRSLIEYSLPALVWQDGGRLTKAGRDNQKAGWRNKALNHMMNIWTPENVQANTKDREAFSWLRFADVSANDVYKASHESIFERAADELKKHNRLAQHKVAYDEEDENFTPAHALFKIRDRNDRQALADITQDGVLKKLMNVGQQGIRDMGLDRVEQAGRPKASAPPIQVTCSNTNTSRDMGNVMFNVPMRRTLYGLALHEEVALVEKKVPLELWPAKKALPEPDHEKQRFTNIAVPSMQRFVTDSGKLAKLDELLFKLKNGGHRVLLYFQMTRMIDMMEEYLTYRNYKYCRLDGSTKLEDRRDTVHDFQTRPDIFIFLLSTRAGGLGINLTSADTVIFYDSDWNPTIDSQAMDRAHRLGQTRQVTVYRLITRGTIEERIRKRALQKEEVQRVVISGGGASVDFSGRRQPENRNRDIAMWLADDDQAEEIERRERELLESGEMDKKPKKGGKKKKAEAPTSLDDMYHEGEGNFDDGSKGVSGTATPAEPEVKGKKPRVKGGKRAKTMKQRLALADGDI